VRPGELQAGLIGEALTTEADTTELLTEWATDADTTELETTDADAELWMAEAAMPVGAMRGSLTTLILRDIFLFLGFAFFMAGSL
jgi:hypothetical protein